MKLPLLKTAILSTFLALLIPLSIQAASTIQLSIENGTAAPGQTVNLSVNQDLNGADAPAGLGFDFNFNSQDISDITAEIGSAAKAANKTITCAKPPGTNGVFRCIIFGININTISSGQVAILHVTIKPNTKALSSDITVARTGASTAAGIGIPISEAQNTILITQTQQTPPAKTSGRAISRF